MICWNFKFRQRFKAIGHCVRDFCCDRRPFWPGGEIMPYKFYECHSHIALDGVSAANAERHYRDGTDIDHTKEMFAAYKNAGIEFLRDGGDKWDTGARAKGYAEEYGITFLTPVLPT